VAEDAQRIAESPDARQALKSLKTFGLLIAFSTAKPVWGSITL
jgi:hypothetical protein